MPRGEKGCGDWEGILKGPLPFCCHTKAPPTRHWSEFCVIEAECFANP